MKIFSVVLLSLFLLPVSLVAQNIENIRSYMSGNNVIVSYDIKGGKFYNYYTISLYVSRDGCKTWEGPLKEVSGSVGDNLRRGLHQITWNVMKESPFVEQSFVFDIRAKVYEEPMKKSFFVSYVGNTNAYLGLMFGMIGKVGWYGEVRGNLLSFSFPDYTYANGEITDYDQAGYYVFTDGKGYSLFSALAGLTFQAGRNVFFYTGIGYGWDRYLYEITNYIYEDDQSTGTYNVVHGDYNLQGFEIDAGVMYRYKMLLFSAGATTLNFKNVGWTVGIGFAF
ncbi:MAG: hypothetical protein K0B08_04275 [Bacteroidales bacterium]|nr:hypothetical protein [Bacteroidales bacterium]